MNQLTTRIIFCLSIISLPAGSAWADACVILDQENDTLTSSERKGALSLARGSLRRAGVEVGDAPCDSSYTISNVRMGRSIIIEIRGPEGAQTARSERIEELGNVYDQAFYALVKGKPFDDTAGGGITRKNVTRAQQFPRRARADSMGYVYLGPAAMVGVDAEAIPVIAGGGYRYELDSFAIDLSTDAFMALGDKDLGVSWLGQIGGLYYFDPISNHSLYAGAGLGWGLTAVEIDEVDYGGAGLHSKVQVGFAMLRASTIRIGVELFATLPFYRLEQVDDSNDQTQHHYSPFFGLNLAVGWSR